MTIAMSALESALLRGAGFRHGFSVRPLDFSVASPESEEAIQLLLRLPRDRVYRVSQVHGARAIRAEGDVGLVASEQADAIVATENERAVAVRIADCVPILLADSNAGAVAAVHAGWRGVVAGVVGAAFELAPFDVAAIGPCIGACCFEIGEEVAGELEPYVVRKAGAKPHGDLRAAVRAQLVAAGVQNTRIEDVPGCTHCDAARFFSYRRDGEHAGRHLAVIATRA